MIPAYWMAATVWLAIAGMDAALVWVNQDSVKLWREIIDMERHPPRLPDQFTGVMDEDSARRLYEDLRAHFDPPSLH